MEKQNNEPKRTKLTSSFSELTSDQLILTKDILISVAKFLKVKDLLNSLLVCSRWYQILSQSNVVWKRLAVKKWKMCDVSFYDGNWFFLTLNNNNASHFKFVEWQSAPFERNNFDEKNEMSSPYFEIYGYKFCIVIEKSIEGGFGLYVSFEPPKGKLLNVNYEIQLISKSEVKQHDVWGAHLMVDEQRYVYGNNGLITETELPNFLNEEKQITLKMSINIFEVEEDKEIKNLQIVKRYVSMMKYLREVDELSFLVRHIFHLIAPEQVELRKLLMEVKYVDLLLDILYHKTETKRNGQFGNSQNKQKEEKEENKQEEEKEEQVKKTVNGHKRIIFPLWKTLDASLLSTSRDVALYSIDSLSEMAFSSYVTSDYLLKINGIEIVASLLTKNELDDRLRAAAVRCLVSVSLHNTNAAKQICSLHAGTFVDQLCELIHLDEESTAIRIDCSVLVKNLLRGARSLALESVRKFVPRFIESYLTTKVNVEKKSPLWILKGCSALVLTDLLSIKKCKKALRTKEALLWFQNNILEQPQSLPLVAKISNFEAIRCISESDPSAAIYLFESGVLQICQSIFQSNEIRTSLLIRALLATSLLTFHNPKVCKQLEDGVLEQIFSCASTENAQVCACIASILSNLMCWGGTERTLLMVSRPTLEFLETISSSKYISFVSFAEFRCSVTFLCHAALQCKHLSLPEINNFLKVYFSPSSHSQVLELLFDNDQRSVIESCNYIGRVCLIDASCRLRCSSVSIIGRLLTLSQSDDFLIQLVSLNALSNILVVDGKQLTPAINNAFNHPICPLTKDMLKKIKKGSCDSRVVSICASLLKLFS